MSARERGRKYDSSEKGRTHRARYRRSYRFKESQLKYARSNKGKNWRSTRISDKRAAVNELKRAPCVDCGGTFDPVCMDFDHRERGDKLANVSSLVKSAGVSIELVLAEVAKCDLVCANCHRLRTHRRGDYNRHDVTLCDVEPQLALFADADVVAEES